MKLKNGKTWYAQDLDNYTPEFLQEIIQDLLEESANREETRFVFVDEEGCRCDRTGVKITESVQDGGKTLKIFIEPRTDAQKLQQEHNEAFNESIKGVFDKPIKRDET